MQAQLDQLLKVVGPKLRWEMVEGEGGTFMQVKLDQLLKVVGPNLR